MRWLRPNMVSVLVVCLGNICRSPMGEAVLRHVAKERGIDITVDSAGTAAYHAGEDPDERTVQTCRKHKVPISHSARQVEPEDFRRFTHILASDESNLQNLLRMKPGHATADVKLWGSYDDGKPIADPYYGGMNGFEQVFQQCIRYSNAFLDQFFKND
ncbi:phosphotyrosine protein phosphatase [Punctularia strigosozonata HHB-11173 SS5]|uniref:phosphotyrosine protein phosphatase n=1 Tax=Punctularia strigosozonata (strain HHB-11173) TaxID=741275 RepID=UPI000441802F|nr:phosphotyrosine protein phosphatase [Punctularia strigosozonata HHB-11173 SS5]EIN14089.1 phosphotyrosine protein phosphatase [Punctularia strigosozonata HHB-11173 SS5]